MFENQMLTSDRNQPTLELSVTSGDAPPPIPAAITDTGCERDLNEDRYAVIESRAGVAWIVCDGMGGATGGELAAQLAIDAVRRDLDKHGHVPVEMALKNAVIEANRVIVLRRQNQAFSQMGTTMVAVMFNGPEVAIANVGDSRAYLVRGGEIQGLTVDHTYVQQLVERGEIQPEEALSHPQAHILTRCIGAEPGIEVDVRKLWIWPPEGGRCDVLLLCSDGLYSLVSEAEIAQIISMFEPQVACVRLVELAKARGGYDNITVAVVPLEGEIRADPLPVLPTFGRFMRQGDDSEGSKRRELLPHFVLMILMGVLAAVGTIGAFFITKIL
jgi:protein phosphatase